MMGIVPGAEVDVIMEGGRFVIVADPVSAIKKKWRGSFKNSRTTNDYMNEVRGPIE